MEIRAYEFPKQRVPASEKEKPEFYANSIDWIISQASSIRDTEHIEEQLQILKGNIPDRYYRKALNPYNATKEKYKRFPADMRNYDLINGVIRRYTSEYIKNPHDFIVNANNAEVVIARDSKLRKEITLLIEQQIAAKIQESYAQYINEGGDPNQFNPQEAIDIEAFAREFEENYIDDISAQGQKVLDVIRDITDDALLYATVEFNFVAFGEAYTYADVVGDKLIKRVVAPIDAYPIPNDNLFVEDYDMFAERRKLTYQQIIDEFDVYLSDKDREFLDTYYARGLNGELPEYNFARYRQLYSDVCSRFTNEEINNYSKQPNMIRDLNSQLYDVWHVTWRGEARKAIVTFVNQAGFIDSRIEPEDYVLNKDMGDIAIEYIYEPQVYEGVRIGARAYAIYPYKCRAIAYNRNGKLPYNGVSELLPGFGKFSIVDIVTPFQVFYNIVAYHREMVVAQNKLSILVIAKSLLGKEPEDVIYKMIADGTLIYDDTEDAGSIRAQQIRMLSANMGEYITQLSNLLTQIETDAKNQVDMTPQRYGEIANSAGKGVTEEAIARGSMGSVIIEFRIDSMRERDYSRDMDYSKLCWIDGLNTSYRDSQSGAIKYISLDINKHIYADYAIKAKNSVVEKEKLEALRQFAFSAAQNGDPNMAIAAIEADNIATAKKLVAKFQEIKEQHEMQLEQLKQQTAQLQEELKLKEIAAKGEEDRKTAELKGQIDKEIALIQADSNRLSYPNDLSDTLKQEAANRLDEANLAIQREKIRLQREKLASDNANKKADRELKEKQMKKNNNK